MYTMTTRSPNLGALPAILVTAILTMAKYKWSDAQIQSALGARYEELKRLTEAQITELAVLLSEHTGRPVYQWFSIIRNAREVGLLDPGNGNGNGTSPPPPPADEDKADNTLLYVGLAVGAAVLLFALSR